MATSLMGSLVASSGCGDVHEDRTDELSEVQDTGIVGDTRRKFPNAKNIPVCFINDDGTSATANTIKNRAIAEYKKVGICFSGWNRCSSSTPCPAIHFYLGYPPGVDRQYAGQSMVGPVACPVSPTKWTIWLGPGQEDWAAVHEIGHGLGLLHEHARTDNQGECKWSASEKSPPGNGVEYFTTYDEDSVMSYCSGKRTFSPKDIQGMIKFYGTGGATTCGGDNGGGDDGGGDDGGGDNGTCTDKNVNCAAWAANGRCSRNPNFMRANCCKSCRDRPSNCVNKNVNCAAWAAKGECTRNPNYMRANCCKSCSK